jgi:hypothetical protein
VKKEFVQSKSNIQRTFLFCEVVATLAVVKNFKTEYQLYILIRIGLALVDKLLAILNTGRLPFTDYSRLLSIHSLLPFYLVLHCFTRIKSTKSPEECDAGILCH